MQTITGATFTKLAQPTNSVCAPYEVKMLPYNQAGKSTKPIHKYKTPSKLSAIQTVNKILLGDQISAIRSTIAGSSHDIENARGMPKSPPPIKPTAIKV